MLENQSTNKQRNLSSKQNVVDNVWNVLQLLRLMQTELKQFQHLLPTCTKNSQANHIYIFNSPKLQLVYKPFKCSFVSSFLLCPAITLECTPGLDPGLDPSAQPGSTRWTENQRVSGNTEVLRSEG